MLVVHRTVNISDAVVLSFFQGPLKKIGKWEGKKATC